MRLLDVWSGHAPIARNVLAGVLFALLMAPCSPAADNDGKPKLRKNTEKNRYEKQDENLSISSASASSFSSSQSDSSRGTKSVSGVQGTATGNASAAGSAGGNANALKSKSGQDPQSTQASSSARGEFKGNDPGTDRYSDKNDGNASNNASSKSSVTKNGVRISRAVTADHLETVTKLDVISKVEEISVRESSSGSIEVRVRDRRRNADGSVNEKVYSAATRDELRKQAPKLVRKIEAFEKLAGTAKATVNARGGEASSSSQGDKAGAPVGKRGIDAKQLMKDQLNEMLQQNADNPALQNMIRKMLQDVDQ